MKNELMLTNLFKVRDLVGCGYGVDLCEEMIASIKNEIDAREARKKGKSGARAAAMRIFKTAKKCIQFKSELHRLKGYTAEDGDQIICDYFRAVKLSEPLPVPMNDPEDVNARATARSYEFVFKNASENQGDPITPPSVAEIKAKIAEAKARGEKVKHLPYTFESGLKLDLLLLLDLLEILPGAVIIPSKLSNTRPVFLKAANGCGVLCPLRV